MEAADSNYQQKQHRRPMSVIDAKFCVPRPTRLIMKKKIQGLVALFSDTLFKVMDVNNNLVFEVTKDVSALRSQMVLFDAAGSPIATMRKQMLTWHNRWTVHKGYSTEKMDVVYSLKASSAFQFRTNLDVNNNLVFEVTKDVSALRSQMVLFDAAGSPIATMRKQMLTWHNRWTVHKGYSTEKMDVVYSLKASSAFQFRTNLDVYLATNTSEETISDYRIKASSWDLSCTVYKGDNIVAEIVNKFTWGGLVGKDELQVTMNPDVDYAFIVTLVAILIDIESLRRNSTQQHNSHMT